MIAAALFGWALVLAVGAPRLLTAGWTERSPRLGVLAWQAASVSFVLALLLGASAMIIPPVMFGGGLPELLTHCVMLVRGLTRSPHDAAAALVGAAVIGALGVRICWVAARHVTASSRRRREHAQALTLLAQRRPDLGAVVLAHRARAAYCLPGRRQLIVITTGALEALDAAQVNAVLAHERAHLKARHHLAISAAAVLHHALPRVTLLEAAANEVPRLLEMAADDSAGARSDRRRVAAALVALAGAGAPDGALAAGGPSAAARVRRLLRPAAPLPRGAAAAALLMMTLLLTAPVGLALASVAWTGSMPDCVPATRA